MNNPTEADPFVDPDYLREANARHDREMQAAGIDINTRIRCAWNIAQLVRKGKLTDKAIAKYEREGRYSAEYREARKKLAGKRRTGNFEQRGGRLIYNPTA